MPDTALLPDQVERALARNDRYLLEFVESLNLCPFAKGCRETGRLHREVFPHTAPNATAVLEAAERLEARPDGEVEVALFLFPSLVIEARPWERFVSEVRNQQARNRKRPVDFFMVAFHPELPMDLGNADRAVSFLRRTPDPTIQLVSARATDRARAGARDDPRELSRIIAEAGFAAVLERGPDAVSALLASIRADRPHPAIR